MSQFQAGDTGDSQIPDVSVLIPAFAAVSTIETQLEALSRQDFGGSWEVIIADNGANDGLNQVLKPFNGLIPSLRVVRATSVPGAGYARECGVREARAHKIAFCDADDYVLRSWLSSIVTALDEYDIVTGPVARVDFGFIHEGRIHAPEDSLSFTGQPLVGKGQQVYAPGHNAGFRRSALVRGCAADRITGQDSTTTWRAMQEGATIGWAPEARLLWRIRPGGRRSWSRNISTGVGVVQADREFSRQLWSKAEVWKVHRSVLALPATALRSLRSPSEREAFRYHVGVCFGGALERMLPGLWSGVLKRRRSTGRSTGFTAG